MSKGRKGIYLCLELSGVGLSTITSAQDKSEGL